MKLCECGCGNPAPIAKATNKKWGHVKGQPSRFVHGHHNRVPRPTMTDTELAWLAGILEGEGSFIVVKRKRTPRRKPAWFQYDCRVQVGMKDRDIIARVASLLGTAHSRTKAGMYVTYLSGYYGFDVMRRLHPLMGARRRSQIEKCFEVEKKHCMLATATGWRQAA